MKENVPYRYGRGYMALFYASVLIRNGFLVLFYASVLVRNYFMALYSALEAPEL